MSKILSSLAKWSFHALHAGDLWHRLMKALGTSAKDFEVISTWSDGAIPALQFCTIFGDTSYHTIITSYTVLNICKVGVAT